MDWSTQIVGNFTFKTVLRKVSDKLGKIFVPYVKKNECP